MLKLGLYEAKCLVDENAWFTVEYGTLMEWEPELKKLHKLGCVLEYEQEVKLC